MSVRRLLELDARLSERLRIAEKPGPLRAFAALCARSGDSWFWAIGLVALWFLGSESWRKWSVIQIVGIGGLAVLVLLTKFLVRRKRPAGEWGGIYRNADPHSFPSGHAARRF
jgi:undecaprenyl-diphosphatase